MLQDFRMEESFWAHISLACSDARDAAHSRNQGMIAFKVGMDYERDGRVRDKPARALSKCQSSKFLPYICGRRQGCRQGLFLDSAT